MFDVYKGKSSGGFGNKAAVDKQARKKKRNENSQADGDIHKRMYDSKMKTPNSRYKEIRNIECPKWRTT